MEDVYKRQGYSGPVTVEVEFDGSSILSVHVLSHSETVNISDRAIDELPSRIVEAQTWDVDAVSSATFTLSLIHISASLLEAPSFHLPPI